METFTGLRYGLNVESVGVMSQTMAVVLCAHLTAILDQITTLSLINFQLKQHLFVIVGETITKRPFALGTQLKPKTSNSHSTTAGTASRTPVKAVATSARRHAMLVTILQTLAS